MIPDYMLPTDGFQHHWYWYKITCFSTNKSQRPSFSLDTFQSSCSTLFTSNTYFRQIDTPIYEARSFGEFTPAVLLQSTNKVVRRYSFYSCLSVQGGLSTPTIPWAGRPPPPWKADHLPPFEPKKSAGCSL